MDHHREVKRTRKRKIFDDFVNGTLLFHASKQLQIIIALYSHAMSVIYEPQTVSLIYFCFI